ALVDRMPLPVRPILSDRRLFAKRTAPVAASLVDRPDAMRGDGRVRRRRGLARDDRDAPAIRTAAPRAQAPSYGDRDRLSHAGLRAAPRSLGDPRHAHDLSQSPVPPYRLALRAGVGAKAVRRASSLSLLGPFVRHRLVRNPPPRRGRGIF